MKNAEFVDRLSLAEMGENRCGTVAQIEGDSRFISRIVSIGLTPGSAFTLLKNDGRLPVLVFFAAIRLSLSTIRNVHRFLSR